MNKPILCLDFDGVIHSYSSGWKGAAVIPDPPVPGALEFIREAVAQFDVQIFSSRSHQWGGKRAMKRWLREHYRELFWTLSDTQKAAADLPVSWTHADVDEDAWEWGAHIVQRIGFPWFKPPAMVTLDDRAITFTGEWPALAELRAFKPWNKRSRPTVAAEGPATGARPDEQSKGVAAEGTGTTVALTDEQDTVAGTSVREPGGA